MQIEEIEEFYFNKKMEGMDLSKIRKELTAKQLDPKMINSIMQSIDERIQIADLHKMDKIELNWLMIGGTILFSVGLFVTVITYFELIDFKGYTIFAYGPIISGLSMIGGAKFKKKEKDSYFGRIKRDRK